MVVMMAVSMVALRVAPMDSKTVALKADKKVVMMAVSMVALRGAMKVDQTVE